jgi:hypothetical protein
MFLKNGSKIFLRPGLDGRINVASHCERSIFRARDFGERDRRGERRGGENQSSDGRSGKSLSVKTPATCVAAVPYASGKAISHVRPWACQSRRTSPPSWPTIMFSIMLLPKPRCVGGVTGGPPDSIQRKLSPPSVVRDQVIST